MIFDPYNDRLARDIRNSLSAALVNELTGEAGRSLSTVAHDWLAKDPEAIYKTYIEDRLALYHQAIRQIMATRTSDPRLQAVYLWNQGLFFEMHELLETIWQHSREPERSALKGWIQAAGVYVHFRRGREDTARNLAQRAKMHLNKGRRQLEFIANIDELIDALEKATDAAPKLLTA